MRRVEAKLNPLMDEMNEKLYDVRIKPPMLSTMSADLYEFSTEDDNGTGMRYKGMILLDIALMRTTKLPFIKEGADGQLKMLLEETEPDSESDPVDGNDTEE